MDIYYTNETLYVNVKEVIDEVSIIKLKKRIFRILEDYGINKVELNVINDYYYDQNLLIDLLEESSRKYQTTIKIK